MLSYLEEIIKLTHTPERSWKVMQYFDNIDQLLDKYLPQENHDDFIAALVDQANSAINQHYTEFKNELNINRSVQPIITIMVPTSKNPVLAQIQYFNSDDEHERLNKAQIVRILNHEVECPIYIKEGA